MFEQYTTNNERIFVVVSPFFPAMHPIGIATRFANVIGSEPNEPSQSIRRIGISNAFLPAIMAKQTNKASLSNQNIQNIMNLSRSTVWRWTNKFSWINDLDDLKMNKNNTTSAMLIREKAWQKFFLHQSIQS